MEYIAVLCNGVATYYNVIRMKYVEEIEAVGLHVQVVLSFHNEEQSNGRTNGVQ